MMTDDKNTQSPTELDNNGIAANATQSPLEAPVPEDPVAVARQEVATLKDQLLRALAETENVRRRAIRDKEDAGKFAMAGFAREMLGVADNLHRALEAINADSLETDPILKTLFDGVQATARQLDAAFEKQSIKKVWPLGEKFDSNLHQAMFEVPGTDKPAGTVVQVLQAGYTLHDRLLRPAMVGVAKGESAQPDQPSGDNRIDTIA